MSTGIKQSRWMELPFCCPHCGNHGEEDGAWEANGWTPFKLIEEETRAWEFDAQAEAGKFVLTADLGGGASDSEMRIECMQCLESFPLPEGVSVVFE